LMADELQRLRAILEEEDLKKIISPKSPQLPADTAAIPEIDLWDAQIARGETVQHFTTVRERVKTGTRGAPTYLDNGAPYKKALSPLTKWFEEFEKKSKSSLKDAPSQYCGAMNID
jgi:hypothetical protein